jgi:chemotaxis protein CheX
MAVQLQKPPTAAANSPTQAINAKLVAPFVNSVRSVFSTMVKVDSTVGRPALKDHTSPLYDVSSIIGFSGDVVGSVVVSFPMNVAQKLVSVFAGAPIDPHSEDFPDALGELANMIAGGAKKYLGAAASITCPSVIIGPGHVVARLRGVPCVVVPCQTSHGDFAIEVNVKQVNPLATSEGGVQ